MGFKTKSMNKENIVKYAKIVYDIDTPETLGGKNIQLFFEEMNEIDPIVHMPDEYIMSGRVAFMLRSLGYALQYKIHVADVWEPMCRKMIKKYTN